MLNFINTIIESSNIPLITAFLLGVIVSISPCPLATNITAVAYISKDLKSSKKTILSGLFYTLGRSLSYTLIALLIYFGLSSFKISSLFQGWGDKVLGPVLILLGLLMFGVIKININIRNKRIEQLKNHLSTKGYIGSFFMGILFSLAFCPYSGALFFGILIPLILKTNFGFLLAPFFGIGTGLPVILFSFIIAYSFNKLSKALNIVSKVEKILRYVTASIFILTGVYYLQFLVKYILNLYY